MQQPSEMFLLTQRAFTFLDEWLFYGLLFLLYSRGIIEEEPVLFWTVAVIGGLLIAISYIKQWRLESLRFKQ